jgi:YD repeat-containing protein
MRLGPAKITRVTDPFGRYASFEYDPSGRLSRITDVIGITSEFTYGTNDFISSLTTPYGTTTFQTGMSGTDRWLEATDPLGAKERIEYRGATTAIPPTESVVPSAPGLATTNAFIYARNTFYWDKRAMASMPYSIDYRKARITHWLHSYFNNSESSGTIESEKAPLENRIWYNYPGNQGAPAYEGTSTQPTIAARVPRRRNDTGLPIRVQPAGLKNQGASIQSVGRTRYTYGTNNTQTWIRGHGDEYRPC